MRNCFLLLLSAFTSMLTAQSVDWFAENPTWNLYATAGFLGGGKEVVTVDRDTIVGGRASKVLFRNNFVQDAIDIVAQSDDSVFLWNHVDAQFYLLYNMKAIVGTIFSQPVPLGGALLSYEVLENGIMTIGTEFLRFQKWGASGQSTEYLVIEKIGMVKYERFSPNPTEGPMHFFWNEPDASGLDGPSWKLCAYKNDNISYEPIPGYFNCMGIVTSPTIQSMERFSVAPNPAKVEVLFSFDSEAPELYQLDLYNLYGEEIVSRASFMHRYILRRGALSAGVYIFSLKNESGVVVQSGKVVFVD